MSYCANLLAVREPDPERRATLHRKLSRECSTVAEDEGWLIGTRAVAGNAPALPLSKGVFVIEASEDPEFAREAWVGLAEEPARARFLPGDSAVLVIQRGGAAVATSSVAGTVPLYYWIDGDRAALATTLAALLRYALPPTRLDADALAVFMALGTWHEGRTFLGGVCAVPAGSQLTLTHRARVATFWELERFVPGRSGRGAFRDAALSVRTTLVGRLRRTLSPVGNLVSLSGGVDSAIVAGIATQELGKPVHTVTIASAVPEVAAYERPFLESSWRHGGRHLGRRDVLDGSMANRMGVLRRADPFLFPVPHLVLRSLPEIEKTGCCRVYAGGEFADELFGSVALRDVWIHGLSARDVVRRLELGPALVRNARSLFGYHWRRRRGRGWVPAFPGVVGLLDPRLAEPVRAALRHWQDRSGCSQWGALSLRLGRAQATKARLWEAMSPRSIAPTFPYLGRDLLELVLTLAPGLHLSATGKPVLRAAARDLVPELNRLRPDKGISAGGEPANVAWSGEIPPELEGVLGQDWSRRSPATVPASSALHLLAMLNMVAALRTQGA